MKKTLMFSIRLTAAFMAFLSFAACYENVINDVEEKEVSLKGEIRLSFDNVPSFDDCNVLTSTQTIPLNASSFEITINKSSLLQTFMVVEGDDVYMMARSLAQNNGLIEITEESTALALVSMHPLFAPLQGVPYDQLVALIHASEKYDALYSAVSKTIYAKRNLFDETNEELLIALSDMFESIAVEVEDDIEYSGSLDEIVDEVATRAIYDNPDVYPFYAEINGNVLTLRNVALTPSYYGTVTEASGAVTPFSILSRADYGGMDMFSKTVDDMNLGDPKDFVFTEYGNYYFDLSRLNAAAVTEFCLRLANSILSAWGLDPGQDVIRELASIMVRAMINKGSGVDDVLTDPMEWVGIAYGAIVEWAAEDYWAAVGKESLMHFGKVLSGSLNLYNKIKGTVNALVRVGYGLTAPTEVNFCLCYDTNNNVSSCKETILYKVGGDEQTGYKGQRLLLPLTVYVYVTDEEGNYIEENQYNKVKFEVVSGGGRLEDETVSVDHNFEASTYWTLGNGEEQKVKAVVVDIITEEEISEPVYFTAYPEEAVITIRLDWNKHSADTDIDLHVVDPYGEKIYFDHMTSASGGYLDRDDVVGPGPEHVRWTSAPAGEYKIYVHYYPNEAEDRSVTSYTVTVSADGVDYQPKSGSISYDQYVPVGKFSIGENTDTRSLPVPILVDTDRIEKPLLPSKTK